MSNKTATDPDAILISILRNCQKGIRLFSQDEDPLVFLEEYDLDEARATVLQSRGKALEAAEAHAKDGRVLEAARVLLKRSTPSIKESRMAIHYVLAGLWKRMSFGIRFRRSDTTTTGLLEISFKLDSNAMTEDEADEVRSAQPLVTIIAFNLRTHQLSMFKSIASYNREASVDPAGKVEPDVVQLRRLAFKFLMRTNGAAALLCLDHVFSHAPNLHNPTLMETESTLSLYLTYVRQLDRFWRDGRLSEGSDFQKKFQEKFQKIFAFEVQQDGHYIVPENTFIHQKVSAAKGILNDPPPEYICSHEELSRITSDALLDRIQSRVKTQELACRGTRGFSPCLNTLIGRQCFNERCQFQHIQPNEITVNWFHSRLRVLFLEFQILRLAQLFDKGVMQYVHSVGTSFRFHPDVVNRYWLQMFHSALCPPIRKLGSLNSLDLRKIPDGAQSMHIIREWTWYAYKDIKFSSPPPALKYNDHFIPDFTTTCTLAHDLDFANAVDYVRETPLCRSRERPSCLIRDGRYSIVHDLVIFLEYRFWYALRSGYNFMRYVRQCVYEQIARITHHPSHVLFNQLRLDLSAFCDLSERLCALFIVERRIQYDGGITNVTLPRSWLTHISRASSKTSKNTSDMKPFFRAVVELMRRIDLSGEGVGEHLRASSARLNPFTSTVYVARM